MFKYRYVCYRQPATDLQYCNINMYLKYCDTQFLAKAKAFFFLHYSKIKVPVPRYVLYLNRRGPISYVCVT